MGTKTNGDLGAKVKAHLIKLGLEPDAAFSPRWGDAYRALEQGVRSFLTHLNQLPDPSRDDTPTRVADMYVEDLCWGLDYSRFPKCTATPNGAQDKGAYDEMVTVERIVTTSLCEHHFMPIYGYTHIAYIPGAQVLGLSKFARVTEFFARRPQIQERMTAQIYEALAFILETPDVAVVQKCAHYCMRHRGAMQPDAETTTSKLGGRFLSNPSLRQEFFMAVNQAGK